jgi:hypothetical protein
LPLQRDAPCTHNPATFHAKLGIGEAHRAILTGGRSLAGGGLHKAGGGGEGRGADGSGEEGDSAKHLSN